MSAKLTSSEILKSSMDQSFANGFALQKQRAVNYLNERADWLRREYLNGGDFSYLRLKEEECRYIAKVIGDMQPPPELIEGVRQTET